MTPKIFITGVTGYIAGDVSYTLMSAHRDWQLVFLVRSSDKAKTVQDAYPDARIVIGGLDDSALLEEEAAKADIVLHAADASDHEGAARAIAAGLAKGHSREHPGYWLHTGGTGILTYKDSENNFATLGCPTDEVYNDLSGVEALTSLPDHAFHRNVDKIVLEAGTRHKGIVNTVIICPPTIYGNGRGPVSSRGRQAYEMTKLILTKGVIPVVGNGKARWNNVHIADLSNVFLALAEKAAAHDTSDELWGPKGYILTENGEHQWTELAHLVAKTAASKGYIKHEPQEAELSKDEALKQAGFEAVSWGLNSRAKAQRAKKYLGWTPNQRSLEEEVPDIIEAEHKRMNA